MAFGLLEAIFSALLSAAVLAMLASGALLGGQMIERLAAATTELTREQHLEQLFDRTVAPTSATGAAAIALAEPQRFTVEVDRNGDGSINARSAERSGFDIKRGSAGQQSLRHQIGRQTVTILTDVGDDATFVYRDRFGNHAVSLASIRSIEFHRPDLDPALKIKVWALPD